MALEAIASPEPGIVLSVDLNLEGAVTAIQLDNTTGKAVTVTVARQGTQLWAGTFTAPSVRQNVPRNRQAPWDDLTDQGWQLTASVGS